MAIELIEGSPIESVNSLAGDNTIWTSEAAITSAGYHSYEYSDGRKVWSPGTAFFAVPERAFLVCLQLSEHAGVDGFFPMLLANERHDVIIPFRHYVCNREWSYPGPNGLAEYGVDGSLDSYRIQYIFPPAGTWRVVHRFSAWGVGANQSEFVPEPYDPIHAWQDDGGTLVLLFDGVSAVGQQQRTPTPALSTATDGLPSFTMSTTNVNDVVLEFLITARQSTDYFVPDSGQTIIDKWDATNRATPRDFGTGANPLDFYIAQKARTGLTTNVAWDYSDSPFTAKYYHAAMVLR